MTREIISPNALQSFFSQEYPFYLNPNVIVLSSSCYPITTLADTPNAFKSYLFHLDPYIFWDVDILKNIGITGLCGVSLAFGE